MDQTRSPNEFQGLSLNCSRHHSLDHNHHLCITSGPPQGQSCNHLDRSPWPRPPPYQGLIMGKHNKMDMGQDQNKNKTIPAVPKTR